MFPRDSVSITYRARDNGHVEGVARAHRKFENLFITSVNGWSLFERKKEEEEEELLIFRRTNLLYRNLISKLIIIDFTERKRKILNFNFEFRVNKFATISRSKTVAKDLVPLPPFKLLTEHCRFPKFRPGAITQVRQVPLPRTRISACPLAKQSSILHPWIADTEHLWII